MVSYAKARAESLVPGPGVGFWERPERLVLMILGALSNRMPLALWILAIGPNITVIHNIVHTWQQTERGRRALDSAGGSLHVSRSSFQLQSPSSGPRRPPRDDSYRGPRGVDRFRFENIEARKSFVAMRFLIRIILSGVNRRGRTAMPKLIAVVGALVICAGIDLLLAVLRSNSVLVRKPIVVFSGRCGTGLYLLAFLCPRRASSKIKPPCRSFWVSALCSFSVLFYWL